MSVLMTFSELQWWDTRGQIFQADLGNYARVFPLSRFYAEIQSVARINHIIQECAA